MFWNNKKHKAIRKVVDRVIKQSMAPRNKGVDKDYKPFCPDCDSPVTFKDRIYKGAPVCTNRKCRAELNMKQGNPFIDRQNLVLVAVTAFRCQSCGGSARHATQLEGDSNTLLGQCKSDKCKGSTQIFKLKTIRLNEELYPDNKYLSVEEAVDNAFLRLKKD